MNFHSRKTTLRRVYYTLIAVASFYSVSVSAQQVNLLSLKETTLETEAGDQLANEQLLRDEDESTATTIVLDHTKPLDLVFEFGNEIVAPRELRITTKGLAANEANIEILVTTISPTAGYQSLRVEPLRKSQKNAQAFRFESEAARWVMIRFKLLEFEKGKDASTETSELSFEITELALKGTVGIPESVYQFNESPAEAIKVLARLSDSIAVELSKEEEALFNDASDGKFDEISFAEASLLSSGVTDDQRRKAMLEQINRMETDFKRTLAKDLSPFAKGERLLIWLHEGPLGNGYTENQTDVSSVLENRTFNCVSSATLYNILAKRLGLDARGIEVPDHAFSILYDGTDHADIETTNRLGFNPARNREGLDRFQSETGFVYIPDNNRSKRREVSETGMVGLTYYNHGVTAMKADKCQEALIGYFKALSLDPENKSAVKNALATLANWSNQLFIDGDTAKALSVLEAGLELAPDDRLLKHNRLATWQRHVIALVEKGEAKAALSQLKTAYEKSQDKELGKVQAWIFIQQAQQHVTNNEWKEALAIADEGLVSVSSDVQDEVKKWRTRVVLRWSTHLIESSNFGEAVDVIEKGMTEDNDYRLGQRLGYLVQEWCAHLKETESAESGQLLAVKLAKRFPKNYRVQRAADNFTDVAARKFLDAKDYESAIKVYAAARELNPDSHHLKQNEEAVWVMLAKPFMDSRNWTKAIGVYERAHESRPKSHLFKQNLTYVVQEMAQDTAKEKGPVEAEKTIRKWAEKFPKLNQVQRMKGSQIGREVTRLIKANDFENAVILLSENRDLCESEHKMNETANFLYVKQAEPHLVSKEWDKAIEIFEAGYEKFPKSYKLKSNLEFAWGSKAKPLLDNEKWKDAADVLKKALESVPNSSKIGNNLRYCESKLEKEEN